MKTYAIGDIHGCSSLLREALRWIDEDAGTSEAVIVTLGDYVDRGPDSRGVIECLMRGPQKSNRRWVNLAGNHDQMMLMAARGHEGYAEVWMLNGARETFASYGIEIPSLGECKVEDILRAAKLLPVEHIEWLEQLGTSADDGKRFFCHAGCMPGVPLEKQTLDNLLWYRHPKDMPDFDFGRLIVHGHTPQFQRPYISDLRVNIDTGACFAKGGKLTVAAWNSKNGSPRIFQTKYRPR